MICSNVGFHIVETFEILEDAICEHRVELVLDARQKSCLLKLINANVFQPGVPIQRIEIEQFVVV